MRAFHFLGVFFLFCAFILTLITSVSLPYLRTLDIARTHFGELQVTVNQDPTDQLRVSLPLFYVYISYTDPFGSLECGEFICISYFQDLRLKLPIRSYCRYLLTNGDRRCSSIGTYWR